MEDSFDKEQVIECMFDPVTSEILAELENGEKELSYLANKSGISDEEVQERLSYLLQHEFVYKKTKNGQIIYSANEKKLAKIIEHDDNFQTTIDSLTKMDSYLN